MIDKDRYNPHTTNIYIYIILPGLLLDLQKNKKLLLLFEDRSPAKTRLGNTTCHQLASAWRGSLGIWNSLRSQYSTRVRTN